MNLATIALGIIAAYCAVNWVLANIYVRRLRNVFPGADRDNQLAALDRNAFYHGISGITAFGFAAIIQAL